MKAVLILAGHYSSCHKTEMIFQKICDEKGIQLTVCKLTDKMGKIFIKDLNLKSFPALIVNNKVLAVGHPDEKSAKEIIRTFPI